MTSSKYRTGRDVMWLAVRTSLAFAMIGVPAVAPAAAQLEEVIARVKPAVVVVEVKTVRGGGRGSGFVYDPAGLVLTNHHVVEGATDIIVRLDDKRFFPATVVDYYRFDSTYPSLQSYSTDVAVLKISASNLPVLRLEPAAQPVTARQGQEVLVLGYPGGVGTEEVSVTRGIVSAVRPGWIQTDAVIVPGNSGGPAIDRQGRVIGLATFVTGYLHRIGGIVPVDSFRSIAESGRRPGGSRARTLSVPGLEDLFPDNMPPRIPVGKLTKSWKIQYEPESAAGRPWTFTADEHLFFGHNVEYFHGALRYWADWGRSGARQYYYIDSTGLYYLHGFARSYPGEPWKRIPPEPLLLLPFPPVVGQSWEVQDYWEWGSPVRAGREVPNPVAVKGRATVDGVKEVVTVPAGRFNDCVKITQEIELVTRRSGGLERARQVETIWYARNVGAVRVVRRLPGTGRWIEELEKEWWEW